MQRILAPMLFAFLLLAFLASMVRQQMVVFGMTPPDAAVHKAAPSADKKTSGKPRRTSLLPAQTATVSISLNSSTITTEQSAVLTWSAPGATSCQGGGSPLIDGWSGVTQQTNGNKTITQNSAGMYVYALTCTGNGSTVSASATLTVTKPGSTPTSTEAITSLPADITPLLSIAGVWQPVANQYLRSDDNGTLANLFPQNIRLPSGREGLIITGWSCCNAPASAPITPINIAVLEQQPDGTLQLATPKYVSDPQTNGGNNVVVADFNNDGRQDFFLPAHNESPHKPASSTAYLSNPNGTYSKVTIGDLVQAHGAALAYINGLPTVFTASYYVAPGYSDTVNHYGPNGFTTVPDIGVGANASVAVGDFYGDGTYSFVCGDCWYGPGFPGNTTKPGHLGIQLWKLSGLRPAGQPFDVGTPYFNGKAQYAGYPSFLDPFKTHNARTWVDDFNHDGKLDILVQGMIYLAGRPQQKNMLQMFQNNVSYQFTDVTDRLNPQYDEDSSQVEYTPQIRDIDSSGVNSYLLSSHSEKSYGGQTGVFNAGNYVLVNDGGGNLRVALHETLNNYSQQVVAWLASNPSFAEFVRPYFPYYQPRLRAYMTEGGKLNFAAIVWTGAVTQQNLRVQKYVIVNLPLRLNLPSLFTKPMVVRDRNGSHVIRTFAGDDTIYASNNGGVAKVYGGAGINTVIYSGPSQNYSATRNADGTWIIKDNMGKDGTDTLTRIQRLQFTDIVVRLDMPTVVGPASSVIGTNGTSQSTVINTAYSTPLQVTVRDFLGNPVPNVTVTFTAPNSGPSGTFTDSMLTATATTNNAGIATASRFTANGKPGPYRVVAVVSGVLTPANFALMNIGTVASVSAASYATAFAQEAIVAGFGQNLATASGAAPGLPLPTTLFGTTITVKDAAGVTRPAPLFFVSPGQVNYLIPAGTATGTATVTITSGAGAVSMAVIQIDAVAPGLFAANANGQGVPAAIALRVKADGSQSYEPVAQFNGAQWIPRSLDLGPPGEVVYLLLYGTGLRNRSNLAAVTINLGGASVALDPAKFEYAGSVEGLVGLDQVNVQLPRSLVGRGEVDLMLTVDGKAANIVLISVK
ncbi:MAG: VCBS repeat-containing protein [Acidobacteria bacterium]|nr:VCBS repeat-containing protein [Acidobacteriota bacterium]